MLSKVEEGVDLTDARGGRLKFASNASEEVTSLL